MKKFLVSAMMFLVFAVGLPLSVEAHNGCSRHRKYKRSTVSRTYYRSSPRYRAASYTAYRRPSFYRRHRNAINIGIATGAGALLGGLLGGRRGVAYGLLGGAGAGALYTYKLNPKRRYYRSY
jgi:hypothetical protein